MQLHAALLRCIQAPLASGSIETLGELFKSEGNEVNPKLQQLVGQVINSKLDSWKEAAAFQRVSLPRLIDFDWTLCHSKSSSEVPVLGSQSMNLSLLIEDLPHSTEELPKTRRLNCELNRQTLDTFIGKI